MRAARSLPVGPASPGEIDAAHTYDESVIAPATSSISAERAAGTRPSHRKNVREKQRARHVRKAK